MRLRHLTIPLAAAAALAPAAVASAHGHGTEGIVVKLNAKDQVALVRTEAHGFVKVKVPGVLSARLCVGARVRLLAPHVLAKGLVVAKLRVLGVDAEVAAHVRLSAKGVVPALPSLPDLSKLPLPALPELPSLPDVTSLLPGLPVVSSLTSGGNRTTVSGS